MYTATFLASALGLAALATAAPVGNSKRDPLPTYSINLSFITSMGMDSNQTLSSQPIDLNVLTAFDISASAIRIEDGLRPAANIDLSSIECRAYKDDAGTEPGSVPFSLGSPAGLSTNLVEVASVLCYVAETSTGSKAKRDPSTYYGINLNFNTASGQDQNGPTYQSEPIELNVLTAFDISASVIEFDDSVTPSGGIALGSVECRAFKDDAGVVPGSNPFTLTQSAALSTNIVTVGSVLCYVTESS